MPTRNVTLTEHCDNFIADKIAAGRFSNASEAVRAGLHLLEREEAAESARLESLRETTQRAFAALDRNEGIRLASANDIDDFVKGAIHEMRADRHAKNA